MYDSGVSAGPAAGFPKYSWEQWFAWYPVKVKGKRRWLTKVCRRVRMYREDVNIYAGYEYGDLFDVLKEEQ
jgi:hypothetical protein